jgi:hypothetical protein
VAVFVEIPKGELVQRIGDLQRVRGETAEAYAV